MQLPYEAADNLSLSPPGGGLWFIFYPASHQKERHRFGASLI